MDSDREAVEGWERLMAREAADVETMKAGAMKRVRDIVKTIIQEEPAWREETYDIFTSRVIAAIFEEGKL